MIINKPFQSLSYCLALDLWSVSYHATKEEALAVAQKRSLDQRYDRSVVFERPGPDNTGGEVSKYIATFVDGKEKREPKPTKLQLEATA